MNNKLTKQVFGINKDHTVVMVEDKTWNSSQQTRMTLARAAYVLQGHGLETLTLEESNDSHEEMLRRVENLLSQPLCINGYTFYIPSRPETTGVDPQWDWHEISPAWFEATVDGKTYAVGLGVTDDTGGTEIGFRQVMWNANTWLCYWYRDMADSNKVCTAVKYQPKFGRLIEAQAWIEDIHEQGKDKSSDIGG